MPLIQALRCLINSIEPLSGMRFYRKQILLKRAECSVFKEPWTWAERDLQQLVDEHVMESLNLDYKACAALSKQNDHAKHELSKDISAFANAAGGTIIYGIQEGPGGPKGVPSALDEGYAPETVSAEWIEQVINSAIHPRIDGVIVHSVPRATGRLLYVVYVPQSNRAPHMADDHKYYKRFNLQSVPMEDYEVRDVMHRVAAPDLEMRFSLNENLVTTYPAISVPVKTRLHDSRDIAELHVDIEVINHADTPAEYMLVDVFFDRRVRVTKWPQLFSSGSKELSASGTSVVVNRFTLQYHVRTNLPIWRTVTYNLTTNDFIFEVPHGSHLFGGWITSPHMEKRQQFYQLTFDGTMVRVESPAPAILRQE